MTLRPAVLCGLVLLLLPPASATPLSQMPTGDFSGFAPTGSNWTLAGDLAGDPWHERVLRPTHGIGLWLNRPGTTAHADLVSRWEHGDVAVEFDFLSPAHDQATALTLYFLGRYPVEIRGERAPGLWQHARVVFRAPRIDAAGTVTAPARLVSLDLNGIAVQSDVTLARAPDARLPGESARGPLVIAGDGGHVALRGFGFRPQEEMLVTLRNLHYAVHRDTFDVLDAYRHAPVDTSGPTDRIDEKLAETNDPFALVITGEFVAPVSGWYVFEQEVDSVSIMRVRFDGLDPMTLGPSTPTSTNVAVQLEAGSHPFQLDYVRRGLRGVPRLSWKVTGPGLTPQPLSVAASQPNRGLPLMPIEPGDRIRTQRSFFPYSDPTKPYAGAKRVYVAAVGSPARLHYAYDLEWHSLLAGWRGGFLDAAGIWHFRGLDQQVEPTGSVMPMIGRPALAALEVPDAPWPDPIAEARAKAGAKFVEDDNNDGPPTALLGLPSPLVSHGYTLAPDGQPTFKLTAYGLAATDRWTVDESGHSLTRTLTFAEPLARDDLYIFLAEDVGIVRHEAGYYLVGDRAYYLELPDDSPLQPAIVAVGSRQQLRAALPAGTTQISYRLTW